MIFPALNWSGKKTLPVIRQTESAECGLACLAMVAGWHELHVDIAVLRQRFNISTQGMTLHRLMECATALQLSGRALRLEPEELKDLRLPCILHWDLNHFVVLRSVKGEKIEIHDPARGVITLSVRESGKHFTGVALELTPAPEFEAKNERKKIRLRQLTGKTPGLWPALGRIFIFALGLELLAMGGPLLNQMVIDNVLVAADSSLLTVITIALFLLTMTQMLLSLARQWASITLSVNFNMQWTASVFHHLVRLPLHWFDARGKGSINARFDAVGTVQNALTTQILEGALDILLAITSLGMMLLYSVKLTLLAVGAAAFYALLRALWYPSLRQAAENSWDASTRESSHFLETLNGILSLRVNGVMPRRESAWLNLNVASRNTQLRQSRIMMWYDVAHTLTESLVAAAVLWLGAGEVLAGTFTVGMLVAYLSFQGRFSASISGLIDKIFAWRMMGVYTERLADIVLTPVEGAAPPEHITPEYADTVCTTIVPPLSFVNGCPLILNDITFSHRGSQSAVLRGASLVLVPGEVVAVTGRSGCGKTTLVKLILGIYPPDSGEILAFGVQHSHPDYHQVRQRIGTVLQDDQLFSGSLADNIIFFSEHHDLSWMAQCAALALLDEDIAAMPMGYQTLIGETGGGLSGGQKQRLLLARALYKRPGFLLLDEATSHLDVESEVVIGQTLRRLGLPILLIAHRPETIASADRVLQLENGILTAVISPDKAGS